MTEAILQPAPPTPIGVQPDADTLPDKCDQCDQPPAYHYTWAWGERGYCCPTHRLALQQAARNLRRTIEFAPLVKTSAPFLRDERTHLQARVLVLQEEAQEAHTRVAELSQTNVELNAEVQRLTVLSREQRRQASEAAREARLAQDAAADAMVQLGAKTDEIRRLELLLDAARRPAADETA